MTTSRYPDGCAAGSQESGDAWSPGRVFIVNFNNGNVNNNDRNNKAFCRPVRSLVSGECQDVTLHALDRARRQARRGKVPSLDQLSFDSRWIDGLLQIQQQIIDGTWSPRATLQQRWSIRQDMLPRNLFHRLSLPLCFATFVKERNGKLFGFALYGETYAVTHLRRRYRALLAQGERSVWAAVTMAALETLGGVADLAAIYNEVEGARPTTNNFWQAKIRQTLQRIAVRVGPGRWAMPERIAA
jgi:hypothetical protein